MISISFLLIGMIMFMLIGVPLAFAIFLTSASALVFFTDLPFWQIIQQFFAGINSFVLTAIPFFLLAGNLMNSGKITDKLINLSSTIVGHIRGGLAHINVLVSLLFGGVSGSAVADTSGVGTVLIPAMVKKGYSKSFSVAVTATSSVLGQVIPPSLIMIIYAASSGTSVQALFIAGIVPGIMFAISMMIVSYIYAVKYNYPREEKKTFKEFILALKESFLVLLMPIIIIGGVLTGVTTATESAAVAVVYSLILTLFVDKTLKIKDLPSIFIATAKGTASSLFCIGSAGVFGYLLAYFRANDIIMNLMETLNFTTTGFIIFLMLLFLILGFFMDAAPAIYIFVPIVVPVGLALGMHPVHLGMIIVLMLSFGMVTPPYGLCLLLACQIAKINPKDTFKDLFIMLIGIAITLIIIVFWADLVLFLPRLLVPKYV